MRLRASPDRFSDIIGEIFYNRATQTTSLKFNRLYSAIWPIHCIENKGVKRSCIGLCFTVMLNSDTVSDVTNAAYPMCFDGFDAYQVGM